MEELSANALDNARQQNAEKPDFFHKTSYHMAGLIAAKTNTDVELHKKAIFKNLKDTWIREGSINEKKSFVSYIQFIVSLLQESKNPNIKLLSDKIKALNKVVADIEKSK